MRLATLYDDIIYTSLISVLYVFCATLVSKESDSVHHEAYKEALRRKHWSAQVIGP